MFSAPFPIGEVLISLFSEDFLSGRLVPCLNASAGRLLFPVSPQTFASNLVLSLGGDFGTLFVNSLVVLSCFSKEESLLQLDLFGLPPKLADLDRGRILVFDDLFRNES